MVKKQQDKQQEERKMKNLVDFLKMMVGFVMNVGERDMRLKKKRCIITKTRNNVMNKRQQIIQILDKAMIASSCNSYNIANQILALDQPQEEIEEIEEGQLEPYGTGVILGKKLNEVVREIKKINNKIK